MNNYKLLITVTLLTSYMTFAATPNAGPGFELFNKGPAIKLTIIEQKPGGKNTPLVQNQAIAKNGKFVLPNNMKLPLREFATTLMEITSDGKTYSYKIAHDMSTYLTWNPAKTPNNPARFLYPQTGRFKGLSSTSDSGYTLKFNIKPSSIVFLGVQPAK